MKYSSLSRVVLVVAIALAAPLFGQQRSVKTPRHGTIASGQMERLVELSTTSPATPDTPPPLWTHSTMASRDGKVYSSLSIGSSPYADVKTTTNIPVVIVPLVVTVNGVTLDPTAAVTNSCVRPDWNGKTPVQVLLESPIFTATDWTMNGQQVGNGQYLDAFQRAQYWSLVQGSNYHTVLHPTVAAAQTVPASALDPSAATATSACVAQSGGAPDQITLGASDTGLLTPWLEGTLIPQLEAQGVINSGQLAYFLFYNTTFSDASGFHSYVGTQTYAVSLINGSDCCSPDVKTISSVTAEWMNDPFPAQTQNRTPGWTAQADSAGNALVCQSNSSVGDPTAGSLFPDVAMPNGVTYHPQELTFYSWFHGAPSIGAGSLYSNNSSLAIDAGAVCQADTTPALSITTPAIPNGVLNTPFSFSLTASGGTGPYAWSVAGGRLPPGLTLSPTGLISGTPSYVTLGSLVTFQVMDASNPPQMASAYYIMTVSAIPTFVQITTNSLSNGMVGVPYVQPLSATGGTTPYSWQLTAGTLPAGLTLNPGTGVISGTPTVAVAATPLTFKVTDSSSPAQGVSAAFTLTIVIPPLTITTTTPLPNGIVGVAYSQTLAATGGTGAYTWQLPLGTLPAGLTLNPATGVISGIPTAQGTASPLVFKVTDSGTPQQTATANLSLTIAPAPLALIPITPPNCMTGLFCSFQLPATGGTPPYAWQVNSGPLPAGLTLNPATGWVTGTPTVPGTFTVWFMVTDSGTPPQTATESVTITIVPAPLVITTTTLPNGVQNQPYSFPLAKTGGTPTFNWQVTFGALPTGLILNSSTGQISGTPTVPGTFTFTVTLTDSGTPQQIATKVLQLTIIPQLTATYPAPPINCYTTQFCTITPTVAGGVTTYTWSLPSPGTLPAGLTLNTSTGVISGTPTATGTTTLTVKVMDSGNPQQSVTLTITINVLNQPPPIIITLPPLLNCVQNQPCSIQLVATGGTPPYAWQVSGLPTGLTANLSTGLISGTPTVAGVSPVTVTVTDSGSPQQTATKVFQLTIIPQLQLTNPGPITCIVNQACPITLTVTGGVAPYTWSLPGPGPIPLGLTLNSTGTIIWTPTTTGTTTLPVKVTDSGNPQQSVTITITINVTPPPPPSITTTALPNGASGTTYTYKLTATGGTAPYTWSLIAGRLPAGMTFDPSTGMLGGVPDLGNTGGGTPDFQLDFLLTFQVTDSGTPQQTSAPKVLDLTITDFTGGS